MRPEWRGEIDAEEGLLSGQCRHGRVFRETEERVLLPQRLDERRDGRVRQSAQWPPLLLQRIETQRIIRLDEPEPVQKKPWACSLEARKNVRALYSCFSGVPSYAGAGAFAAVGSAVCAMDSSVNHLLTPSLRPFPRIPRRAYEPAASRAERPARRGFAFSVRDWRAPARCRCEGACGGHRENPSRPGRPPRPLPGASPLWGESPRSSRRPSGRARGREPGRAVNIKQFFLFGPRFTLTYRYVLCYFHQKVFPIPDRGD